MIDLIDLGVLVFKVLQIILLACIAVMVFAVLFGDDTGEE